MKKLLLSLSIVAFVAVAQASDNKPACKDSAKGGCCGGKSSETVKTSTETKGGCCSATQTACKETASKGKVSKPLMSPKAAELASR